MCWRSKANYDGTHHFVRSIKLWVSKPRELTARYFYPWHVLFILPSFFYLKENDGKGRIVSSDSHERTGKRPRSWKYRKLWKFYDRPWENVGRCGEWGYIVRRKGEGGREGKRFTLGRMAMGIPRTFTASQFFRLIIQRARMLSRRLHLTADRGLKFLETEKSATEIRKTCGDRSLKNITPFSETMIFIAASEIDASTASYVGFFEILGYANCPRFVIAFCEMDRWEEGGGGEESVREASRE